MTEHIRDILTQEEKQLIDMATPLGIEVTYRK